MSNWGAARDPGTQESSHARLHFLLIAPGPAVPPLLGVVYTHCSLTFKEASSLLRLCISLIRNSRLRARLVWVDSSEAQCKEALKASAVRFLYRVHGQSQGRSAQAGTPWCAIAESFLRTVPQYPLPSRNNCNCHSHPPSYYAPLQEARRPAANMPCARSQACHRVSQRSDHYTFPGMPIGSVAWPRSRGRSVEKPWFIQQYPVVREIGSLTQVKRASSCLYLHWAWPSCFEQECRRT